MIVVEIYFFSYILGLWHFWVFLVGSPWESHFYSCEIKIIGKNNKEEICYK